MLYCVDNMIVYAKVPPDCSEGPLHKKVTVTLIYHTTASSIKARKIKAKYILE